MLPDVATRTLRDSLSYRTHHPTCLSIPFPNPIPNPIPIPFQPPWCPEIWADHLGRAREEEEGQAALSAPLALAVGSGFLPLSLGHYRGLAGLRLAARGAGARWDAGPAAFPRS